MATHDYIISNGTGTVIRADINNALSAIVTNNSSSSEPATKYAYMWWADTSAGLLKIRNSANDGWITLFQLDGTLTLEDGSNSAPAISFRDDTNTGIFSSAADNLDITTGGTTRVNVSSTGINVTGTVTDDGATHDGDVTFTGASANIIFDKSDNALEFADNAKAVFGSDSDLQILHNGSDSFVRDLGTGGLYLTGSVVGIKNSGANENGLLFTEDGSVDLYHNNVKVFETTSTGVQVTGNVNIPTGNNVTTGSVVTTSATALTAVDNGMAVFGTGLDLRIYHDGTNSYIKDAGTGVLRLTSNQVQVTNAAASEVLANFIEDGAVELYYNNVKVFETTATGVSVTGQISQFETGGNNKFITKRTGAAGSNNDTFFEFKSLNTADQEIGSFLFQRESAADDSYFILKTRNTGGSNTERFRVTSTGNLQIPADNAKLEIGAGQDLQLYHDGTHSYITNTTGDLEITSTGDDVFIKSADDIFFKTQGSEAAVDIYGNGGVTLYYDNTKRFETTSTGIKVTGTTTTGSEFLGDFRVKGTDDSNFVTFKPSENLARWHDNDKAVFGGSNDLQIYHDGTDSFITNSTGDLDITNTGDDINITAIDDIRLKPQNGEQGVTVIGNGAVELFFDNVKKLETTSTGIKVIQDVVMDVAGDTAIRWANDGTNKWSIFNNSSASDALTIFDNNGSGTAAKFSTNGGIQLYYDNSNVLETINGGARVNGVLHVTSHLDMGDSDIIKLGDGDDLQIKFNGTDSIISHDTGSGLLRLNAAAGGEIHITKSGPETLAKFIPDGAVELYHDNSKKFESTSFGCTVQGGITFGSDTAAANQLDDYEEGVFTPSLEFGGATTGITYSSVRGGSYTKIGRQVTVNFAFTLTSKGSASGDATLAGLPFAVEDLISGTSVEASGVSSFWNDVATDSANIVFAATNSSSELQIRHTVGAEDDTDDMTEGDFENNTALRGSITYFTAT